MSTTTLARRLALAALLALSAVAAPGCGGGGWYSDPYGTLQVENDPASFEGIEAVEVSQLFGPIDHYDLWLAPGEIDGVDLVPGTYDVDLLWSDGSVDTVYGVDIYDGYTTPVTGLN